MKKVILAALFAALSIGNSFGGEYDTATFAGGCFWCLESDMDKVEGVVKTVSGYMGGHLKNPSYKQVSAGSSGHAEVVQITYDPSKVSYQQLLATFWKNVDPTVKDQQFCDHGSQYRSAIFYRNDSQKEQAIKSLKELESTKPFKGPIYTEIAMATEFYPAEDYHQDYYQKNPVRYNYYRFACGRDQRLEEVWGKKH